MRLDAFDEPRCASFGIVAAGLTKARSGVWRHRGIVGGSIGDDVQWVEERARRRRPKRKTRFSVRAAAREEKRR